MGQARQEGADYIVTGAGFQSNWCTQATAAACRLGMKTLLIKKGPRKDYDPSEYDGNHLLHVLMGAQIRVVRPEEDEQAKKEAMTELKRAGHKPHLLLAAGSTPPGSAGYLNAMLEMATQAVEQGINIDYIVHATGSGGTQAGLVLGVKALSAHTKIIAATTGSRTKQEQTDNVFKIIKDSIGFLGLDLAVSREDLFIYDQYAGGGYGFLSEAKAEAIKILAETEGIYIDPVYTGSAMACLIDLVRQGFFRPTDVVIFLHTGGPAALFPYKSPLKSYLSGGGLSWRIPPWSPEAIIKGQ
jgi:1-aminocyclopropane-1-carboxylate deaminase/D-cysteine desulfhydrase-like pyridoxal-dependent ACC family enzyme